MPDLFDWTASPEATATAIAIGYFLGTIPFGLLLTRFAGLGDVRDIGSGNIGATNVLRTGHKSLAAATLLLDLLKGTCAVLIGSIWGEHTGLAAGVAAFVGHLFPLWLKFKGGKGVATYIGVLLGAFWPACIVFCATWLTIAVATRYSSLSALVGSVAAPFAIAAWGGRSVLLVVVSMSLLLIVRHRANIVRLIGGTESKIGAV